MPTFNAIDLGPFVRMRTRAAPVDLQITNFAAVNGLTLLAMGSRGYITECDMACVGTTLPNLGAVETTFLNMQTNVVVGVLFDSMGRSFGNVIMVAFDPVDDIVPVPGYGYGHQCRMEFIHLN